MKIRVRGLWLNYSLAALLILSSGMIAGCGTSGATQYLAAQLQQMVDTAASIPQVPGMAVCIIEASGNVWTAAAGLSDISTGTALGYDNLFRIASNSKTFTATAVLMLRDDGNLDLDEPISKYVHDLGIPHDDEITIRMLLNHTSGLADHENDTSWLNDQIMQDRYREYSPQELIDVAVSVAPDLLFAPGAGYHYSNSGYVVLSVIVSRVSNMPFTDFIQARIIEPFGLVDTYILPGADMPATPYAHGYTYADAISEPQDFTVINESWDIGAGGMISTVCDLATFVRLLFGGAILTSDSLTQMETYSEWAKYGLGATNAEGIGWGHDGSTYGYDSLMGFDPDTGVAVAAFVNSSSADIIGTMDAMKDVIKSFKTELGY